MSTWWFVGESTVSSFNKLDEGAKSSIAACLPMTLI